MKYTSIILYIVFSFFVSNNFAQDGQVDISFGNNGYGYVQTAIGSWSDRGYGIALQDDGKIVAVGQSEEQSYETVPVVVRYLSDGNLDLSFGVDGIVFTDLSSSYPSIDGYYDVVIQNDQKIVAGGHFGPVSIQELDIMLVRYQADGSLDLAFGNAGITVLDVGEDEFAALELQADQKIMVAAVTGSFGLEEVLLARYNIDGGLDPTFGTNGLVIDDISGGRTKITHLKLLDDGSILVGALTTSKYSIVKYTSNGARDTAFGTNGVLVINISASTIQGFDVTAEGKILVGLGFCTGCGPKCGSCVSRLVKYLPDGTLDTSFGNQGIVNITIQDFIPYKVLMQENQRVLVLGFVPDFHDGGGETVIARYWLNGGLDATFGPGGQVRWSQFSGRDMILQDDGKILHFGFTWWYTGSEDFFITRYENNPLGIEDQFIQNLTVSPNPVVDEVTITHDLVYDGVAYQLVDISGKKLADGYLYGTKTTIDLSELQSGLYILNAGNNSIRLIKE